MAELVVALRRTLWSLRYPRIWAYVLMPAVLSLVFWLALAGWGLSALVEALLEVPPLSFLASWGVLWAAHLLAYLGGWALILAAVYLTASVLSAIVVLPWMLRFLAAREYPDLGLLGQSTFWSSTVNSLWAALVFVLAWLLTLPLWLVPGGALVLPVVLMAWLNRQTFAYDALSEHALKAEWAEIRRIEGRSLWLLGLLLAVFAHIPLIGFLAPALAALAYIHFCLEALRRQRQGAVLCGEARRMDEGGSH